MANTKIINGVEYQCYDNFPDIINCDRVADIPSNYVGVIGVPKGIVENYLFVPPNPHLREIKLEYGFEILDHCGPSIDGKKKYERILIQIKTPIQKYRYTKEYRQDAKDRRNDLQDTYWSFDKYTYNVQKHMLFYRNECIEEYVMEKF